MKKRAAYIDHSYHKITKSTKFFMDLLSGEYDVDLFWDESWNNGPPAPLEKIAEGRYDAVIFFQTMYPPYITDMLNCENILFIPMYDNIHAWGDSFWTQYRGKARFICFSKTLYDRLTGLGLHSKYVQYFIPPHGDIAPLDFKSLKGFFWQRCHDITWRHVRRLMKDGGFSGFHLHGAVDPGFEFYPPSPRETKKYNIQTTSWFQSGRDFKKVLGGCNVFFASRQFEGIGMSFIEAMTLGHCVVAPDSPTMNEYIIHGETGLLYDINNIKPLDFNNAGAMGRRARDYCAEGYRRWDNQKGELMEYIRVSGGRGCAKSRLNKSSRAGGPRKEASRLYSALEQHYIQSETINRENERMRAELENIRAGYAYRIGSFLLSPLKAVYYFIKGSSGK